MRATSAAGVGAIGRMRSPYDAAGPARTALFATCEAMRMRTGPSVPPTVTVVGASIPRRPSSATNAARSRLAPGDSSLASSIGATIPRSTTSAAIALAIVDGAGASANSQPPLRPLMGSGAGRVTRARARMALGARAVGERLALRVHVAGRVLGARVGLGLGLRDGGLDLGVKIRAYLRELVLAGADLEEVAARVVYGILRHPLAHFLFGAVARVVVVGRVWLEAIALQLDERRTAARPRDRDGLLGLRVGLEHVHAIGDEARHRVGRRLVGDVLRRHLPLEPRRNREEVILDDEHHRQLVHRREVRGLVEVARARRRVAAER